MSRAATARPDPALHQALRFFAVGAISTAINLVAFHLMTNAHVPYLLAAPAAFLAGTANGYAWNRAWTFHDRTSRTLPSAARYLSLRVVALVCATGLLALLVEIAGLPPLAAQAATIPLVAVASFLIARRWVYAPE